MKVIDWIERIIERGLLCDEYTEKVRLASSKKELFDIVCDANGVSFLPEMREHGLPLDYDIIKEEFKNFINGRCKVTYKTSSGDYTSSLFCGCRDEIVVDTTISCLCDCKCEVRTPPNSLTRLYIDQNSEVSVFLGENARCVIRNWGKFTEHGDEGSFSVKEMRRR